MGGEKRTKKIDNRRKGKGWWQAFLDRLERANRTAGCKT